jgi:hypothetical protein
MFMKLLLILTISLVANLPIINSQNVEDFEKGFKYVLDNQDQFAKMNEEQFIDALKSHFNVTGTVRIQTLSEVLQEGNHQWSNDVTVLLREFNNNVQASASFEDFLRALTTFENGASRLNSLERPRVLKYIKEILEIMMLLVDELQYYPYCCDYLDLDARSWWDKWGKCAAAILGGASSGALGGAAIGTAAVPAIGTIVGGVVGGISGGLTGAMAGC